MIQRKAVGPSKIGRHQLLNVRAVHACMHDSWPRAPVCPVNNFLWRIYDDRPRRVDRVRDECAARSSISGTHQDAFDEGVRDVEIVGNPIQRKVLK